MTLSVLAAFWAVSFLFIITPGADWAYAISAGMRGRLVTPAVAGMLSGHLLATVIVAAGVGGLVARNPMILSVLTVAGALYLLWLGVCMLRDPATPQSGQGQASDSWSRWAWKGLCVSGLNPKVLLLFLALLPQFTDPLSNWSIPTQIIALGGQLCAGVSGGGFQCPRRVAHPARCCKECQPGIGGDNDPDCGGAAGGAGLQLRLGQQPEE